VAAPSDWERLLAEHGARESGHFQLSSGLHSDTYIQTARVMEHPDVARAIGQEIASRYSNIDVVLAPAVGSITLGFAVAMAAGARAIYAERDDDDVMRLRRGFDVLEGERALVVDNVITTGASAEVVYEIAGRKKGVRLGVAAVIDRSTASVPFPINALVRVEAKTWSQDECPLCAAGQPVQAPGSRHLPR
jgi:orotate phosphoribosyltransferase